MNNNLKLISVRLEPETLQAIDEIARKHEYWNRNQIINRLLAACVNDFQDMEIYDMLRRPMFEKSPLSCHYKINQV